MAKTEEKEKLQVNVDFTEYPDLYKGLEKLVEEEMTDRSKLLRKLVAQEIARRQQLELPLGESPSKSKSKRQPVAA